jgi:hypothetical protein
MQVAEGRFRVGFRQRIRQLVGRQAQHSDGHAERLGEGQHLREDAPIEVHGGAARVIRKEILGAHQTDGFGAGPDGGSPSPFTRAGRGSAASHPDEWSALDEKLSSLLGKSDMMVVAGAPPPESPDDIYARLARKAQASGAAVLMDARGEALTRALCYSPLLVKLNDRELAATCGGLVDTEEKLRVAMRMLMTGGAWWTLVLSDVAGQHIGVEADYQREVFLEATAGACRNWPSAVMFQGCMFLRAMVNANDASF